MADILSLGQIMDRMNYLNGLPADHEDSPTGFARNADDDGWDIHWGGYLYWITDADLNSIDKILDWVNHLGGKNWKGMTGQRLAAFIAACRARLV